MLPTHSSAYNHAYFMGLTSGTRLGPYEIVAPLGAGGMGEVYRARDTRLGREVAVKILPPHSADNADLKQRFEREAKAISSLNHPHISTLHDIGSQDGTDFLVMEYLEGETLADRLRKGALPLKQVITIGSQIADALSKAHRQGLIHRDLKPGNIMLTKTGAKLMDFGLAKPTGVTMGMAATPLTPSTPTMSVAALSAPVSPLTQKGQVVGTFQYMAPELLQGAEADARSDLFSFGCVLYEMASGRRAFEGKSQLGVMTAILEKEPEPLRTLAPALPSSLERLVAACLAKDPAERMQTAHDVGLQLRWVEGGEAAPAKAGGTSVMPWAAAAVLLVLLLAVGFFALRPAPQAPVLQASIVPPQNLTMELLGDTGGPPTLSPDGTLLAFRAHTQGESVGSLWLRHMDTGAVQHLDGTEHATFPFWSPDSRNLGFFTDLANGKMYRVGVNGGTVTEIAPAAVGRGGSWGKGDVIVYAPDFQTGLFQVSAQGGTPAPVTKLNRTIHTTHRWPTMLPDGEHFLYIAANHGGGDRQQNGVYFASLDGKVNRRILAGEASVAYSAGYLLYYADGALRAQRLDPSSGELTGEPITISEELQFDNSTWHTSLTASETDTIIFARGGQGTGTQLAWYDRSGKEDVLKNVARGDYLSMRLSPDGRRVALTLSNPFSDIMVIDLQRGTPTRLTFGGMNHFSPMWSPDGKRIAYAVAAGAGSTASQGVSVGLHIRNADGSGNDEEVLPSDAKTSIALFDWTPDGKYLIYARTNGTTVGASLWALPLFGDRKPFVVVTPPAPTVNILEGRVSYDGHWLAYGSDESGRSEIYLTSFPVASGKIMVSTNAGGNGLTWRQDGKELEYGNAGDGMEVAVDLTYEKGEIHVGESHSFSRQIRAIGTCSAMASVSWARY